MQKLTKIRPAVIDTPKGWWAGTSEEYLNIGGPFANRDEAIAEGRHAQGSGPFYICEAALYGWRAPEADTVMDAWIEDHDELWWEDGFSGFDGARDAEVKAHDDLQTVLNEWFDRHRAMLPTATAFSYHSNGEWIDNSTIDDGPVMSALIELAERCEAAAGPDRGLDAAIYRAVTGNCPHLNFSTVAGDGDCLAEVCLDCGEEEPLFVVPRYTASIDAATMLLPEGYDFRVERFDENKACAWVWKRGYFALLCHEATTPALTLTAAALRAHASMEVE